jgi:hypothetical protein
LKEKATIIDDMGDRKQAMKTLLKASKV